MSSMTFQINDYGTSGPAVWVDVLEVDGTLRFNVRTEGSVIGDLRGLFFDVADESIIKSLSVSPLSAGLTQIRMGNDSVTDLGGGANMNGLLGGIGGTDTAGYDVGLEIGTSGIGKDDYQAFSFSLSSSSRFLTLADISSVNFGARLTSVGTITGARTDSSKMLETTSTAISAASDTAVAGENGLSTGTLIGNDSYGAGDAVSVTGWSGGNLGEAVTLTNSEGATLTVNRDGTYSVDASATDALSAGETLTYAFNYQVRAQSEQTSWSDSSSTITVSITGENDGPMAQNDVATAPLSENGTYTANVLANDSDIDRLDTIQVTSINGQAIGNGITIVLESGARVSIGADGTFHYDTNGAFAGLIDGQSATDSFSYTISDNHGASAEANVSLQILGEGTNGGGDNGGGNNPALPSLGLSHGYWKTHDGSPNANDWNIALDTSFEQYFGVDAGSWKLKGNLTVEDVMFDQALELQGGAKYALAREAVTAVLNAVDEKNGVEYDFAYSLDEVREMVQEALLSDDPALIETTKDVLEASHH